MSETDPTKLQGSSAEGEPASVEAPESSAASDPVSVEDSESKGEGAATLEPVDGEASSSASPSEVTTAEPRPRWDRSKAVGLTLLLFGATLQLLLMASDKRFDFSVPLGFAACLVAALGILALTGSFKTNGEQVPELAVAELGWPFLELLLSGGLLVFVLKSAVSGVIPKQVMVCAIVIPLLFLWVTVSLFRLGQKLRGPDEQGDGPPWYRRHGFWLIALMTLIYLPLLGSYSLIDPWETHYGEVAREMLARDDWISLWWAQDGWFWSKPVLDFWLQGLSFSLFGVRYWPDQMIASVAEGRWPQPEWAARFPIFLMTVIAMYVLYRGVASAFGRRAAFLGSLILATTPYWFLIGRQTMTDMPYVAGVIATMGFFLLAVSTPDEVTLRGVDVRFGRARARVTALHLLLGTILLVALPQILYLGSRNLTLHVESKVEEGQTEPVALSLALLVSGKVGIRGLGVHSDEVSEGSGGGNCGLPGNSQCKKPRPAANKKLQPVMMALVYAALAGFLVWSNRRENRLSKLFYLSAWLALAIAGMAKGAPGLVLPLFVIGAYVALHNKWDELTRAELGALLLIFCISCLPWFVQMYLRHGDGFINRLLLHDMYQRAFQHVHDTNQGEDTSFRYYIWQLGYGLFPWNGILAAAFVWWFRRDREASDPAERGALILFIWALGAFGMFTITLTKFHHYILPMVPAVAMLGGLLLGEALDTREGKDFKARSAALYLIGATLGVSLLWLGLVRFFPGSIFGVASDELPARPLSGAGLLLLGLLLLVGAMVLFGRRSFSSTREEGASSDVAFGAVGIVGAVAVALAGRDMAVSNSGDVKGSARLMHLFTYQYQRAWPENLDFRAAFIGFTLLMVGICLFWIVRRWRSHLVVATCAFAVLFAGWGANVYMVACAPHWGQRETIVEYYKARGSPEEPLVAFQMNWKGENFYTGNHVPAFVSSGKKFKSWVDEQKKKGVKVMYFTTEHARVATLKRELSSPKDFEVLTTKELNNKFFLARVRFD